ncbi:acyl-CoA synthetase [Aquimarina sp. AD10]|uniref:class I adenylate-forming enzyme family protein n=1 Tax=Aquimarina sp. AD10 TaxID=1714849 RepID=UPI000E517DB4|nr:class I adenylate-forming enzyme family protein [Aquimarina sp. AD10]AXT59782.1 acyl-CoA synthetase [Aquimarina sp. AD10]RKM97652.1 acyl-CoA synthetase [Aquimarina sp. AD10]
MIPKMQNFLAETVRLYPKSIAVQTAGETYTFSDIEHRSNELATYLQNLEISRGDRVVVLLGNTIETIISFWAILKVGAIVIPVGVELKSNKIEYILKDSGASVLVTNNEISLKNKKIFLSSGLKKVVVPHKSNELIEALFEDYYDVLKTNGQTLRKSNLISIDLAAIIYTSGSTGEPKGVMLSHQNMITATNSLNAYLGYQKEDKVLCALPLSFDYGLYQMIMSISRGATLVLETESTWPIFLLKKIVKEKITILPAVPTMVMLLHEQNKKYQLDLSSIRLVTNTGAALTRSNIEMIKTSFLKAQIFSMYGLTECKRCTYLPPEDIDLKPDSIGIAIPNTELWLVDENNDKIVTPNTIGQLVIRGATVMQGYWNKPEKTAEKLKQGVYPNEKVLYTGDFCSFDIDGYLYFKGRMDHMINSKGIKVSPKEVEDYIGNIPEVNAVVVTGVPHLDYGEALFAFVVLNEGQSISENDIITACAKNLEVYKVPEYVNIIQTIPKTPNGKFNVIALKDQALKTVATNNTQIAHT